LKKKTVVKKELIDCQYNLDRHSI